MFEETCEPSFERVASPARESAREVVARACGQYRERGFRVDGARAFLYSESGARLEVACGSGAQSPVAADDRDRLEASGECRAKKN